MLDAFTAGTTAFKDMTSLYGLNTENVDNVMSDLQEVGNCDGEHILFDGNMKKKSKLDLVFLS